MLTAIVYRGVAGLAAKRALLAGQDTMLLSVCQLKLSFKSSDCRHSTVCMTRSTEPKEQVNIHDLSDVC